MQDGARPHTTYDYFGFLQEKFQNRVASNRLEFFWPEKSPDLNPLFFFCGIPEKSVNDSKYKSLQQLKKIVELCARNVSRETDKSSAKLQKKSHLILGGHFEHFLK